VCADDVGGLSPGLVSSPSAAPCRWGVRRPSRRLLAECVREGRVARGGAALAVGAAAGAGSLVDRGGAEASGGQCATVDDAYFADAGRFPCAGTQGGRQMSGLVSELEIPAEVAGLAPGRLTPQDVHSPGEPEPAQQRQRVRPLWRRRMSGRLKVPQELLHRPDALAVVIAQEVRLPRIPGLDECPCCGTMSDPRSRTPSPCPSAMSSDRNDRCPGESGD
jgi:hypothetical protein